MTELLLRWRAGEERALDLLLPRVYDELRRIARRELVLERAGQTLGATDLVHEAFLRLVAAEVSWNDRAHFLAVCARVMRRILVDRARARTRVKRGGAMRRVPLDVEPGAPDPAAELLDLDEALRALEERDPRKAQIAEMVHFGGLTYDEVAAALDISRPTVHRDLRLAEAWLRERLRPSSSPPS